MAIAGYTNIVVCLYTNIPTPVESRVLSRESEILFSNGAPEILFSNGELGFKWGCGIAGSCVAFCIILGF